MRPLEGADRLKRALLLLGTAGAILLGGVGGAAAQGELACTAGAEILRTEAGTKHVVTGAPLVVSATLESFSDGTVSDLTAQLDDGTERVALPAPAPGTVSRATLVLPDFPGRAVLTVSWLQSEVEFVSVACRGSDTYVFNVGPPAGDLRAYLRRAARAQVLWLAQRKRLNGVFQRFEDAIPAGQTDVQTFAAIRSAARVAAADVKPIRRISLRYRALVLAADPPYGLGTVNDDLAVTALRSHDNAVRLFAAISRAATLADITRASRASTASAKRWGALRDAWREAVVKANKNAGVRTPRWATRVGR